jgi:hypothetical protein
MRLSAELEQIVARVRRDALPFRMLVDNRGGTAFATPALRRIVSQLKDYAQPGDRTALLVACSLSKVRAREGSYQGEAFISESAALTWLNAWEHLPVAMATAHREAVAPAFDKRGYGLG